MQSDRNLLLELKSNTINFYEAHIVIYTVEASLSPFLLLTLPTSMTDIELN